MSTFLVRPGISRARSSACSRRGAWNLAFAAGIIVGGFLAGYVFANPEPVAIAAATRDTLAALGVQSFTGLAPGDLFGWSALLQWRTLALLIGGGLLVGFGTAYAGGCTSGHALSGVADLQPASFVAMIGFFIGGICRHVPAAAAVSVMTTSPNPRTPWWPYLVLGICFGIVITKAEVISWFRIQEMFHSRRSVLSAPSPVIHNVLRKGATIADISPDDLFTEISACAAFDCGGFYSRRFWLRFRRVMIRPIRP